MNPHLTYYRAQAHTADLIREAQQQRLAGAARRRHRRPRPVTRRIVDRVTRAGIITCVPTASTQR
jgi:hypothetical protein